MVVTICSAIIVLTMILANTVSAQSIASPAAGRSNKEIEAKPEQPGEVALDKNYFKGYVSDTKSILTSPVRWEKSDGIKFSLVAGTVAGLYFFDQNIQEWVQKKRNSDSDQLAKLVKPFGEGVYTLPALGLFYLYGYTAEDKRAEKTALLSVESFLISGLFTQTLKYAAHRRRPEDSDRYDRWDGPGFSASNLSFPSSEATAAFSVATVVAYEYEDTVWAPPLAYSLATLAALARINDNAHWASDVFLGSTVGYFTAKTIVRLHKKKSNYVIVPITDGRCNAVAIAWRF